jgi:hypothetical protein
VGLLSDAMESFVNLASAIFALVMVTIAQRPPDADHPYGHHKAEYFSSGFEGILIIGAALGIIWAAGHRLFNPQPLEQLGWGLALSVGSSGAQRPAGLGHVPRGARAPLDCAGGRCQAPGHRRMDLGRRGGGPGRRHVDRLAVAGRVGGHGRGAEHPARGLSPACSVRLKA